MSMQEMTEERRQEIIDTMRRYMQVKKDKEKLSKLREGFKNMEKDAVIEAVRADLLQRSEVGIKKYGVTLDQEILPLRLWLNHAYQECLDQAAYLKKAMMDMDSKLEKL